MEKILKQRQKELGRLEAVTNGHTPKIVAVEVQDRNEMPKPVFFDAVKLLG